MLIQHNNTSTNTHSPHRFISASAHASPLGYFKTGTRHIYSVILSACITFSKNILSLQFDHTDHIKECSGDEDKVLRAELVAAVLGNALLLEDIGEQFDRS